MWGGFVFFALVAGAFQVKGDIDCEKDGLSTCQHLLPQQRGIFGTAEDFDLTCPQHIAYYECIQEYSNQCGTVPDPELTNVSELLEYFRDACNKESAAHAEIEKHLPCLQSHLNNVDEACTTVAIDALTFYMEKNNVQPEDDVVPATLCYQITSMFACYTAHIEEECEAGAKDFVFDALRRTKYLDKQCPKENSEKHLALLEAMELNIVMKDRIKELLAL